MTTEQPDPTASASASTATGAPPRALRRRATDRVLGGVASGIADYLNIDALIVRAVFVGLMIFGGSGLVLYVGAWLLIPVEGRDESPAEAGVRRLGLAPGRTGLFLLVLLGVFLLFVVLPHGGGYAVFGSPAAFDPGLVIVVLIVLLGVVLLRRGDGDAAPSAPETDATTGTASSIAADRTAPIRRPSEPRGPLAMLTLAVALIAIGVVALLDTGSPDVSVTLAQLMGLGLAIVGAGLLIGSWWGNARLLILPAVLLLPAAWATTYMRVPLEGGFGSAWHYIDQVEMLQAEYRLIAGDLTLDLRTLPEVDEPVEIAASVAMGQLNVLLPPDAEVEVTTHVGAGAMYVLDEWQRGTDLVGQVSRDGDGQRFVLDLATGIGPVSVEAREPDAFEHPYVDACAYAADPECRAVEEGYLEVCEQGREGLCYREYGEEPMPTEDPQEDLQ